MARQSRYRYSPAVVNSPLALVAPTSMMNPQDPEAGYIGEDEDLATFAETAKRIHAGWHSDTATAGVEVAGRFAGRPVARRVHRRRVGKPVARPIYRHGRRYAPAPRYVAPPPAVIVVRRPMAEFEDLEDMDAEPVYGLSGAYVIGNILDEIHDDEDEHNY